MVKSMYMYNLFGGHSLVTSSQRSTILVKVCWYFSSTANQLPPLPSVLLKQCVDWLELFTSRSETLCLFPILQSLDCVQTRVVVFFSAHTERKARWPWEAITWMWQKVCWITIVDCTSVTIHGCHLMWHLVIHRQWYCKSPISHVCRR